MDTIKVKPWGKDQGDYVIINVKDFDPDFHEKVEEKPKRQTRQPEKPEK